MILILYLTGLLEIWHLFIAQALTGVFEAFQIPAYSAATTLLVPKQHYTRASGMRSMADSASQIVGPFLAGTLLAFIDIDGIMFIDVATFIVAVITLFFVRIPSPSPQTKDTSTEKSTWQALRVGFDYILQRPGLLGLLLIFLGINFFAALTYFAVLPALILARTGGDELALASVEAALGIGGVVGALALSIWGGTKRKIHAILGAAAISFWLGDLLFAVGRTLPIWIIGAFLASFFIPFIVGANQAIWQTKVPPAIQGRVFSIQMMLKTSLIPLGYLIAGPLADYIFEPAMTSSGVLVNTFGWLVGNGPGAGIGLMFACTAILGTLMSLSGYLFPAIRRVEDDLPDYDEPEGLAYEFNTIPS